MKPKDLLHSVTSSIRRPSGFQRLDDEPNRASHRVRFDNLPVNIELKDLNKENVTNLNGSASASNSYASNTANADLSANRERRVDGIENGQFQVYNAVTEELGEGADDCDQAFPFSPSNVRLEFGRQPLENDLMNVTNEPRQSRPFEIRGRNGSQRRNLWNCLELLHERARDCRKFRILLKVLIIIFFVGMIGASLIVARYIWMYQKSMHSTVHDFNMKIFRNQSWPLQDVNSRRMNISFLKVPKEEELSNFKKMIAKADMEGGKKNTSSTNLKKERVDPYHPKINGKPTIHETYVNGCYYMGQKLLLNNLNENSSELDQILWKGLAGSVAVAEMRERLNVSQVTDSLEGSLPVDMCYQEPNATCNATGWYRSIDGKCNNMFKKWGSRYSPFRRIIDTQGKWKNHSHKIPRAALVSKKIYWRTPTADLNNAAVMLPLWGMFILQDTLKTATSPINCCDNHNHNHLDSSKLLDNDTISEICNLTSATFYTHGAFSPHSEHHGHKCSMKKVIPAQFASCDLEPRTSFNLATSFIDASNIYGSSPETLKKLRDKKLGRLKVHVAQHHYQKHGYLPTERSLNGSCFFKSPLNKEVDDCVATGNDDVNLIATVTALNTLFLRQHNNIAELLHHHNPHWDDEKLFQESRRILIAQVQHITFNEYLPQILGKEMINLAGLSLESGETYYRDHNRNVDSSVSNAYAGAVGYFWYSMLPAHQKLSIKVHGIVHEFEWDTLAFILRPYFVVNGKSHLEALVRGMAETKANLVGLEMPGQLHKIHLKSKNSSEVIDLVQLAVEWGRDLDLPPYLEWRKVCGFEEPKAFYQIKKFWYAGAYEIITSAYSAIEDVDLLIGMLAEVHIPGGRVGPTLACLLADQFLRFRKGDRYWYEADVSFHHFTEEQLKAIRKTTLARIICDNIPEITDIQQWPMLLESSDGNPTFSCSEPTHTIPKLNFLLWKEYPRDYHSYTVANNTNVTVSQQRWELDHATDNDIDPISKSESEEEALYESSNNEPNSIEIEEEIKLQLQEV